MEEEEESGGGGEAVDCVATERETRPEREGQTYGLEGGGGEGERANGTFHKSPTYLVHMKDYPPLGKHNYAHTRMHARKQACKQKDTHTHTK